jgi:HlyD family secretion protein
MSIRDTSGQDQPVATSSGQARKRRRWLLGGAIGVAVLLLAGWLMSGWSAGSRSFDAARVRVATVTRGDLVRDISADGRVIAANSPTLYAIAGGTVSLNVVAGDVVEQGTELAVIDSPELRSQLAQEQATLASLEAEAGRAALDAQVALSAAQRALDQASVDRQAAERDLQRFSKGFEGGAVSQIDVARADDALKKADLGLIHARREFSLQGQGANLDSRNKQLLADRQRSVVNELQRQVDALTLRAPFDGQVGQVLVEQRANVAANAPVLGVVDLTRFEVEVKVPESFARDLAIGMSAQLTGGGGEPYPATVSAVSPEVVNGEVTARLRFADQQPPGLRQNQRMRARVVLDTREDVLMVERGPFLEQGSGNLAYVMDGNVAVRKRIQTGVSSIGAVEVVEGLAPGDRVVVSGADQFGDAERVRISGL